MILIDKMKDFKIYKVPTFLPTRIDNKKKFYTSLLLTPNFESSKKIMTHPLFINKKRYESYFLQRDVSYYINSKKIKYIDDKELEENAYILEISSEKRNSLPDSAFGLPKKRKYPLDTEARVRSAIKFFNYVDPEDEKELADNIIKAMKKFNITDINVSDKNRFSKYYKSSTENFIGEDINGQLLQEIKELKIFNSEDQLIFFNEDAKYDGQLRRILFQNRIKQRKDSLVLLEKVKKELPFILYAFPELSKYKSRNIFLDLYYYNEVFFNNNNWNNIRGLTLYNDFLDRLLNNINIESFGYHDKKIFIPITGWYNTEQFWNFKVSINPISLIYQRLFTNNLPILKKLFGNTDVIFVGDNKYFKINFSKLDDKDSKKYCTKFRIFVLKIFKGEEFLEDDIDSSAETDSSEVIMAKIVDKIEDKSGADLTKRINKAGKLENDKLSINININSSKPNLNSYIKVEKKISSEEKKNTEEVLNKPISKSAKNLPEKTIDNKLKDEKDIMNLAGKIYNVSQISNSEEEAIDKLDNDIDFKNILIDLQSDGDDDVKLSPEREARLKALSTELMNKTINNKTIEEILSDNNQDEIPKSTLDIASPNKDNWKDLSYMNFDKNYNLEKDIINAFRHFENTTRPMVIRDIQAVDNSTSEDRLVLYTVEYEDYRGKRFKVKLDIPIMKDNRFLLRGNNKSIQNQFFNMPCLKTESDTCQIISNYNKIFVTRYGQSNGRSTTICNRFIKACKKYINNDIKFTIGNNQKVSDKYNLPIDYIDISSMYSKIETDKYIIYFNQDEIRNTYKDIIDLGKGIPFAYSKEYKNILYFNETHESFIFQLISILPKEFINIIESISASNTAYSRCSILGVKIPLIVICAYHEGLRKTLDKANISYNIVDKLDKDFKYNMFYSYIKFNDGYLIYEDKSYISSLLMNGLKECPTDTISISEIDNRNTYLEFLDNFGGRFKADGLDNFYDLMIDPITKETLEHYKLPTDYVSLLLAANKLLGDNNYIRHNDTSSRRIRRYEIVAAYTYKVLANAYGSYCNEIKHRNQSAFKVNQDAVIVALLTDPTSSDDSCINALRDIETTNSVSTKGLSGMNADRAYSLDKRTYDDSMINVLGMSTGFSGNVGVSRQTTLNSNIEGERGYVKPSNGNIDNLSDANTLTATEALTPFGSNRDDPMRTAMTFIQTAKHSVRTVDSDPLLVTNGSDEALAYMSSDRFAFKAKQNGTIKEITNDYIIITYEDGSNDFVDLRNNIVKNSDGGYFVPLKLDPLKDFKVGDKVSNNDIIAYDKSSFSNSVGESDNIAYNIGKLAKIAIVNTDEGFEDSGVITERMAKKLATPINYQYSVYVSKDSIIDTFLEIGDNVEVNDNLMTWIPPFDDEAADILLKNLNIDNISDLGKRTLKSEVTGKVTKIAIYRTVDIEEMSESLQKIVTNYEKPLIAMEKKLKANGLDISQIPAHYKLPTVGKLKGKEDSILIEFYVEFLDTVGVGDKVVYFSANKATEKSIIPEGAEPYTSFRPNEPIDAFVSEVSIDKRMVTSTLIYGSLQKLMIELDRSVKDIMNLPYDDSNV